MEQFFRALKDRREASSSAGPGGETFLLVGLGNPGREYRETRHNFGFMVADRICERAGTAADKAQLKAITATATINGRRVLIAKPQTFMNLSGQAVSALLRYYKIPLARLLVMHDDLDLPFGTLRMRPGGGSGGQKGLAYLFFCPPNGCYGFIYQLRIVYVEVRGNNVYRLFPVPFGNRFVEMQRCFARKEFAIRAKGGSRTV